MQRMHIYYFSGTGNAKQIAEWLREQAEIKNIPATLSNITKDLTENIPAPNETIAFISPIHGFNYPPVMLHFIHRLPPGQNNVLFMCTRAGLKIGPFVTPGVTGIAFLLATALLKKKGYRVIGCLPFDMPSNWLTVHPALKKKATDFIFSVNHKRVETFFDKAATGRPIYRRSILSGILLFLISAAYYGVGRFFLAKTFYTTNDCIKCGKCIKNCPLNALIYKNERPYWTVKCENCMKCITICPTQSIQAGHLLILITVFLCCTFSEILAGGHTAEKVVLFTALLFPVQFLLYRVQHKLLPIPIIGKIIKRTSLTSYKFWGRYKSGSDQ